MTRIGLLLMALGGALALGGGLLLLSGGEAPGVIVGLPGGMYAPVYARLPTTLEECMAGSQLTALVRTETACVIEGRVVEDGGGPASALVSLMRPFGTSADPLVVSPVSTDAHGRFSLRTLGVGEVVVVARSSAFDNLGATARAPAVSTQLTLGHATRIDAGTLRVERAEVLRLNVTGLRADAGWPEYTAELIESAPTLSPFGTPWRWSPEGWVERLAAGPPWSARVVELSGARAGTWRVRVRVPGCAVPACHEVLWGREITMTVPGPPGELDLRSARLQVTVRGPEGPLKRACVVLRNAQTMALWTDEQGLAQALLRPHQPYLLEICAGGHRCQELPLTMPAAHEVEDREVTLVAVAGFRVPEWTTTLGGSPFCIVGPDGQPVAAELRVLDWQGAPLAIEWAEDGPSVRWVSSGRLVQGGPISRLTPTNSHRMRLEVSAPGYQPKSVEFQGGNARMFNKRRFTSARQTVPLLPIGSAGPPGVPPVR